MGRSPCCDESGLKKGPWTPEEDEILVKYIKKHGHGSWRALPKLAGLNRCGKSCRLRWTNYLRPDIKRGKFSPEEEQNILNLHSILGNKWSAIASHLPGRTDNEIKNFWNTHLKKKLIQMGFDPMTHRPRTDIFSTLPQLLALANLKELMNHHSIEEHALRLQAETVAKIQYLQSLFQSSPASMIVAPNPNPSKDNNLNGLNEIDSLKLLSSLSQLDSSSTPLSSNFGSLSMNSLHENNFPFTHMPELQNPSSFQTTPNKANSTISQAQMSEFTVFGNSGESPNSPWQLLVPSKSSSPIGNDAPMANNHGDTCSCASFDAASCSGWPDILLDDALFNQSLL